MHLSYAFVALLLLCKIPLAAAVYLSEPPYFNPKVEVVGCFITHEEEILLLHRQKGKTYANLWAIPGGKLEKGETPIAGAVREVFEETAFDISNRVDYLMKVFIRTDHCDFIYHMVKCPVPDSPGTVKIHFEEHKGFTWVTPADALKFPLMEDEDTCIKLIYPEA